MPIRFLINIVVVVIYRSQLKLRIVNPQSTANAPCKTKIMIVACVVKNYCVNLPYSRRYLRQYPKKLVDLESTLSNQRITVALTDVIGRDYAWLKALCDIIKAENFASMTCGFLLQ